MVSVGSKWIKVANLDELPEGTRKVFKVGRTDVLLINQQGTVYAMKNNCPHMGFPLNMGEITEDGCIICPLHHSRFDLASGDVEEWSTWPVGIGDFFRGLIKEKPLSTYKVWVEGNSVFIELA